MATGIAPDPPAVVADAATPSRAADQPHWVAAVRRARDVVGALVAIVVLAPLMLAIALAVRLDSPGPAVFRQRRLGRGMRPFTVLKFRTMRADSDPAPHREYVGALIAQTGATDGGNLYKLTGDSRVTRVGGLLRRCSLDELPQLFNVLRGDMSLVGPRPVIAYEAERYPDWYFDRFRVRPGMTGLWQVSGRNERTYEEMVRLDVEYAATHSLRGDAAILLRTVLVVLGRRGAA